MSEIKRIVLILPQFPKISETFIVHKFLGLVQRGLDVHIVTQNIQKHAWEQFPELSASGDIRKRVYEVPRQEPHWLVILIMPWVLIKTLLVAPRRAWHYVRKGRRLFGWGIFKKFYLDAPMIRLNPDLVHFEFGSLAVGRTYLKELLSTKLSVSFRGYDLNYIGLEQPGYYNDVWQAADAVHFLGENLWQRAKLRGAPIDLPHALIPPAVDLSRFPVIERAVIEDVGSVNRPLRIISVGRLHWKKGYEFSLQAIRQLKDMGIQVVYEIIGGGDYQAALYFARHQLGLEKQVTFLGEMPHAQVLEHLAWADVFLHGAVSEGFCNAVLEAQAMGLPVACSDADGLRENVAAGVTGFVVPRRNPQAMAEKLALLAGDGGLRQKMGAAGKVRVAEHFRIEDQLNAFEVFYLDLFERQNYPAKMKEIK